MPEYEAWNERQRGRLTEERLARSGVTIIGVGAIGSYIALAVAKMGIPLSVWDADSVSPANIGAQLYGGALLGYSKPDALKTILELTTVETPFRGGGLNLGRRSTLPFSGRNSESEIYVLAVDSMETRKQLVLHGARPSTLRLLSATFDPLVIDVRAGWNTLIVATCRLRDQESVARYKATLYSDAEASSEPCQARSVAPTNMVCAGLAASIIKQAVLGEPLPEYLSIDLGSFMSFGDFYGGVVGRRALAGSPPPSGGEASPSMDEVIVEEGMRHLANPLENSSPTF